MKRWAEILCLLLISVGVVTANEVELKRGDADRQRCSGMYDRKSWGGQFDPYILVKFKNTTADKDFDPLVSLVIFEWKDEDLIGRRVEGSKWSDPKETICDDENIEAKLCESKKRGTFILAVNATEKSKRPLPSYAVNLNNATAIQYPIENTGFYCVSTFAFSDTDYSAIVTFSNAFGELPAAQIAKLPFYGGLTITYAVLGAFWAFLYVQHRSDILPVQNYITATIIFLIVEQLMTWGFYDYQNRNGKDAVSNVLMVIVAVLNAGRNSLSFFLLLIVCMGYGVVKPSLGKTMIYVRFLAIAHFFFGVIYAVASLSVTPDSAGPLVLLVILPLSATLTAFYVWTLNSLGATMKDLIDRKQKVKAFMYKKLWWCILGSIIVIFGFFFINSFVFAGRSQANFVPEHWQTRWFILDGWLNLVYLFDFTFIAYLWRPTANNRRFAMSDEIAQEDDGFEIRSLADSLEDEDEETGRRASSNNDRAQAADGQASSGLSSDVPPFNPVPAAPSPRPRESLDGETIFAVGEDGDKWSDDEDEGGNPKDQREGVEDERKRLTGKDA